MFFGHDTGNGFTEFNTAHIITLILFLVGIGLIYVFRNKFKEYKYEKQFRYGFAAFLLLWEFTLYIFEATSEAGWVWADNLPFISLCGITLYLAIILLVTKNYKLFEIGYFFTFGAIASLLFPDSGYGPDRYRYYQFILGHAGFFYAFMYMMFVHNFIPTIKSFYKSVATLAVVALFFVIINPIIGINGLFLTNSDGTPFEIFDGYGRVVYIVGVYLTALLFMYIWYLLARLYKKLSKSEEYNK